MYFTRSFSVVCFGHWLKDCLYCKGIRKSHSRLKATEFVFLRPMRMNRYWQEKALLQIVNCYCFQLAKRGEVGN